MCEQERSLDCARDDSGRPSLGGGKEKEVEEEKNIRINKYLAQAGVCSRREADRMIEAGEVEINGRMAVNGDKVAGDDEVRVKGERVDYRPEDRQTVVLKYYKPRGIVCSNDGQGSKSIYDQMKDDPVVAKYPRLIYVGRLDKQSEGLLLLTNDGEFARQVSAPGNFHEKEYVVTIDKPVVNGFLKRISGGVELDGIMTRPCRAWKTGERTFHIVITQGINRQIRRMCEVCGAKVTRLKRIRVMDYTLGDMRPGEVREV